MRRHRKFFLALLILLTAAGLVFGGLVFGETRTGFYAAANAPRDYDTHERAGEAAHA